MSKRRNNLHMLDTEQKQAFGKFQRDLRKVMPHMIAAAEAAKQLHQAMIQAPQHQVLEAPNVNNVEVPEMWTVGHAKVNYVEHIKTEGAQD